MACAYGELAEDCAILKLKPGEKDKRVWRAPCPACKSGRAIEFDLWGKSVRWNSFCTRHPKESLFPLMRELLGDCLGGKGSKQQIEPGALIALALAPMPPMSLKLALLELAGVSTADALDKLGVRRENRARVIRERSSVSMQSRRSLPVPAESLSIPAAHPFRCKSAGRFALIFTCFKRVT